MRIDVNIKPVNRVRFEFVMDAVRDKAIVDKLSKQSNKAEYIRGLILKDIKKRG